MRDRGEGSSIYADITSYDGGFEIYDVTNPANIYLKSYYYNGGAYLDADIQGNYAYAVLFDTTVQIIDITDNNCVPVNKFFVTGENAWGINVENNLAFIYTSTNLDRYLNVIDIKDPLNPIDLGTYRTQGKVQTTSLTEKGKHMYISDYYDFSIFHPLFNFNPLPFRLLSPVIGTQFYINNNINFKWKKSEDANGDTLSYTLKIWNSEWDTNIITQADTSVLNVNNLSDFGTFNWTVIASDGMYDQPAVDTFNFEYVNNVGIGNLTPQTSEKNKLLQNYPNPFNNKTIIGFDISATSQIKINVYNAQGKLIRNLYDDVINSGYHKIVWDGKNNSGKYATNGLYFVRMEGNTTGLIKNTFESAKKIFIVR